MLKNGLLQLCRAVNDHLLFTLSMYYETTLCVGGRERKREERARIMTVKRRKRSRRHRERGVRRGQERGRKIRRTGGKRGEVEREERKDIK